MLIHRKRVVRVICCVSFAVLLKTSNFEFPVEYFSDFDSLI